MIGHEMSGTEIVTVINASDAVTGEATRAQMRTRGLMHRVNYILVFNAAGEILTQRRTAHKDIYPGMLDFAAGGVVLAGESYRDSAIRELREELNVSPPLAEHFDLWFEDAADANSNIPPNRTWGKVFSCAHEGPFQLQESEVASVKFMPVESALAINTADVTPDSRQALLAYIL